MTTFCFRLPRAASSLALRCLLLLATGAIAAPAVATADTGCPRPVADAIPLLETMGTIMGGSLRLHLHAVEDGALR